MALVPGTLIFDLNGRLVYFNHESVGYLPSLKASLEDGNLPPQLPEEIFSLYRRIRKRLLQKSSLETDSLNGQLFFPNESGRLVVKAISIGSLHPRRENTHILIMIEPQEQEAEPDLEEAALGFQISRREMEVLKLICRGLTNQAIAEALFISRHTVKDHVKHIMRKTGLSSRQQISANFLNRPNNQGSSFFSQGL